MNAEMMRIARLAGLHKDPGSDREYMGDFDWRLFGDLIVLNCCNMMIDLESKYPANLTVVEIKKEFGVW